MKADSERSAEISEAAQATAAKLGRLVRHLFVYDRGRQLRALDETGLNVAQLKVLLALVGAARTGEDFVGRVLAEQLGVSEATISRAVEGLHEAGLVTRVEVAEDRRLRRLAVTEAGNEMIGQVAAARMAGLREFAADLTDPERQALDTALDLILQRDEIADVGCRDDESLENA